MSVPHTRLRPSEPPHAVQEVSVCCSSLYVLQLGNIWKNQHILMSDPKKILIAVIKNELLMSFEKKKKGNTFQPVHATVSYICILLLGNQHVGLGRG